MREGIPTVSDQRGLPEPPGSLSEVTAGQLFAECQASERNISKAQIKKAFHAELGKNLLSRPLFVPWVAEDEELLLKERYPFDFSIPLPMRNIVPSHKLLSQQVSRCLKGVGQMELRWLLLARWLRDEGICEPSDLLPKKVLDHLIKQFKKKNRISVTDVYYTSLIDNWVPYFERLLDQLPKCPTGHKLGLTDWLINKCGYERLAVESTIGPDRNKRSALSAACEWLVRREDIPDIKDEADAGTLRNAYSRVHGSARQKPSNPS